MKVGYQKSAEKDLLKLDKLLARRIFTKILLLQKNPFSLGSQKLAGGKGYRTRVSQLSFWGSASWRRLQNLKMD